MKTNWITASVCLLIIAGLYGVELSKAPISSDQQIATLDDIEMNKTASAWGPFYRVRATLIDGQSAHLSVPDELQHQNGQTIELTGAPVFFGNGCKRDGDAISVTQFYLLPTLGLAQACETLPDIEMRWTVLVKLNHSWVLHCDDMIDAMATVNGVFRIDQSKPYESVFFIDDASATLAVEPEH